MTKLQIHTEVFSDITLCIKKQWYKSLGDEMPRICRLLTQDGKLPGERPVHYVKSPAIQNRVFHAGINLPDEDVGKLKGARIIYIKENIGLIKVVYVGGHKDKRYEDSYYQVPMIEQRYATDKFVEYAENLVFTSD